jgi:hypothetical protein
MCIEISKSVDLSNKPYLTDVPDLTKLDSDTSKIRLAGLYLFDIKPLICYEQLYSLDISFTYVRSIPSLPNLSQLTMVEVELDNYDDLCGLPSLTALKMTHDNFTLSKPLEKVKMLHCAVIRRPDLLFYKFPNLEILRFEHIHPQCRIDPASLTSEAISFYQKISYQCQSTTRTYLRDSCSIGEFDDEVDPIFDKFNFMNYVTEFGCGLVEYCEHLSNLSNKVPHNIHTMRYSTRMNIYNLDGTLNKSYETYNGMEGECIRETISDDEYIKIHLHYNKCMVYYPQEDDGYNPKNKYIDILKRIMYNKYELTDEIIGLINEFDKTSVSDSLNKLRNQIESTICDIKKIRNESDTSEYQLLNEVIKQNKLMLANTESAIKSKEGLINEPWSVDKLILDIKQYGLTPELKIKVKFFDKIRHINNNDNIVPESKCFTPPETICPRNQCYDLPREIVYKELTIDDIKDIIWYKGQQLKLTLKQKQQFIDIIKNENNEYNETSQNIRMVRFDPDGTKHIFKYDENGNEIPIDSNESNEKIDSNESNEKIDSNKSIGPIHPNCEIYKKCQNDDSDEEETDSETESVESDESDVPANIMKLCACPGENSRSTYIPRTDRYNNIVQKTYPIICDDIDIDNEKISLETTIGSENFLKWKPDANCVDELTLNFYGIPANLSTGLIENHNGCIVLGTSGGSSSSENIDALLDKQFENTKLSLDQIFFIFKNRLYTSFLSSDTAMIDYTNDVVVLNDGTVGWGGTFYPFNVICDPHPNLDINKKIIISSPLNRTVNHNNIRKCCNIDKEC